jgi:hypothetical protein
VRTTAAARNLNPDKTRNTTQKTQPAGASPVKDQTPDNQKQSKTSPAALCRREPKTSKATTT